MHRITEMVHLELGKSGTTVTVPHPKERVSFRVGVKAASPLKLIRKEP